MKKIALATTFALCLASLICRSSHCDDTSIGPRISVDHESWDLGRVKQNGSAERDLIITNNGFSLLSIEKIHPDCDCITAEADPLSIAPGETARLKVTYKPGGKPAGDDIANIAILSDDRTRPTLYVTVYAVVVPDGFSGSDAPNVPAMTADELYARMNAGEKFVLLDVRDRESHGIRHIPAAVSFPRKKFEAGDKETLEVLEKVDKSSKVVVYCGTGYHSSFVTQKLRDMGYDAVKLNGISFWTNASYPVESDMKPGVVAQGIDP